jgi:alpha-mannosidase
MLRLRRGAAGSTAAGVDSGAAPAWSVQGPLQLERAGEEGPDHWRLGNGRLSVLIGPGGVEQLWDAAGVAQLEAPLTWCRWRDRGEFWDAWDLAADYRSHPLPWTWDGGPQWLETGPLCCRFCWRGRCGSSPVRLDGRLLAGSPWLELVFSSHWRQCHELLRLEIPLAHPASRWAADTPGGVIERPATPQTPRERARWEVSAISWMASVTEGSGGGLAVLLDGPQGVSASSGLLGVSLLRAPTWPDPGADNGWQRQRLALLPCPGGWRAAAAPQQAVRLREPLWCRPCDGGAPAGSLFPALEQDLQLVALARAESGLSAAGSGGEGAEELRLSVQNLGPCRRRLTLGGDWQLLARCDGLGGPLGTQGLSDPLALNPWQLGHWRLRRRLPAQSS